MLKLIPHHDDPELHTQYQQTRFQRPYRPDRVWNYDANGNTQSFTGTDGVAVDFSYDALNWMVASRRNAVNTAYTINALGQRSSKIGPNGISQYVYGPDGLLLFENSNGNWTNYIYFGGELVAMIRSGVLRFMYNYLACLL